MGLIETCGKIGQAAVIAALLGLLALAAFGIWALIGETWGF